MPSNAVPSYPGVSVQELFNLSLSVANSPTAVPVIADNPNNSPGLETAQRCHSWQQFTASQGYDPTLNLHRTLQAYFENGGGPCYLVNAGNIIEEMGNMPDATLLVSAGWDISAAVGALCGPGKGLFAILDGPRDEADDTWGEPPEGPEAPAHKLPPRERGARADESEYHDLAWQEDAAAGVGVTAHAAAYYPYLVKKYKWKAGDGADLAREMSVPPSAAMAGLYCAVDRSRGVWKAPANVAVAGGYRLKYPVTDALVGAVNSKDRALNTLCQFPDTGVLVWGARTMHTEDLAWRYINVRRLFDTAERDIRQAMQFAVFEPNTPYTWIRVKVAIEGYLHGLWQAGALQGARQEQGYFVAIGDGVTMTRDDIDQGIMIVKIGLAAARPAEFIVLQFSQEMVQA